MKKLFCLFGVLLVIGSAWAVPPSEDSGGIPYSGATGPVDLGSQNVTTTGTFSGGNLVVGTVKPYDAGTWDGDTSVPTRDEVRDKLEAMVVGQITNVFRIASFTWDGGGAAITAGAGTKRCIRVPFAATITKATIKADASTTSTVAIYKDAWATGALATTDINGATADLTVTAAIGLQDSTLTGWTTTVTAGDEICAACTANDNAKWLYVVLEGSR